MKLRFARFVNDLRLRLASALMGGGWYGVVSRLWLIRDRAMRAVTEDGRVTLADCEALAEALYAPMPGTWELSIRRTDNSARPTPPESPRVPSPVDPEATS